MANPELIIFGAALAPLAVAMASLVGARAWRHRRRRVFQQEARRALARHLGFYPGGPRELIASVQGRRTAVAFGLDDPLPPGSTATGLVPLERGIGPWSLRADPDPFGAPNRRASSTIEVECAAGPPARELLVEMSPPVVLRGPRDVAFALLELPLRDHLVEGERIQWTRGRLRVTTCHSRAPGPFVDLVQRVASLAADLEATGSAPVHRRLIDEALFGSSAECRLRAIRLLVEFHPTPLTRSALVRLCDDPDAVIQLNAARALDADGLSKLRVLAEGDGVPETIRVAAIDAIVALGPPDLARLLTRLMRDRNTDVATLSLRRLGQHAGSDALEVISAHITEKNCSERVILAGVEYLERIGFRAAATALQQLSCHRSEIVQSAAVDVIGRHGDIRWLAPLTHRLCHHSLPQNLAVSIETAVTLIRARHRAGAGRLSLSPESSSARAGALSAPGFGQVGLTDDDAEPPPDGDKAA